MMNWDLVKIYEGWTIARNDSGYTLTAKFYAPQREFLPRRGDRVPMLGLNAVPSAYVSYVITEVETNPATLVGPFLATVTAKPWLKSLTRDNSDSLLRQANYSCAYTDMLCKRGWTVYGHAFAHVTIPKHLEDVDAEKRRKIEIAQDYATSPFRQSADASHANQNVRMLQVTATFYTKALNRGLDFWGRFDGIVPVKSFPDWLKGIPGGDNRWRLVDEHAEYTMDTDAKRPLYKLTRTLLGIPESFRDSTGARMQWDQRKLGQRDWDEGLHTVRFNIMHK